jgi:NAD(P)-dependent dehydrogenase (short-subunit alcohol dehydrogenase family)
MTGMNRRSFLLASGAAFAAGAAGCSGKNEVRIDTNLPVGPFGAKSTAEEVTAGIDLSGKIALVTGCTSGLGYETLRVLALRGARVIGTGRTRDKAAEACARVEGETVPVALELADRDSIAACAGEVHALGVPIDILVCNAGINTFGELELVDGIESMFAVNFLGHFALVHALLPLLHAAPMGRIVHVGSRSGYRQAPPEGIDFDNLRGEKAFDAGAAYGRSKLANALFSLELARRLQGTTVTSNVIHPGLVTTNIARNSPWLVRTAFDLLGPLFAKSVEQGAATQCYVATSPALAGVSGAYFEDCNPVRVEGPNHMTDTAMAARLWGVAEAMLAG